MKHIAEQFELHFTPMTTNEAIAKCFAPDVYQAIKTRVSPPELLKLACLECFKFPITRMPLTVAEKLRQALITLETTGKFEN